MHEIICPHCNKAFQIDDSGYADILKQVRDDDFEKQLHNRLELAEQDKRNSIELAQARITNELQKTTSAKDSEIQELKAKIEANEVLRRLAVTEALSAVEKERDTLLHALENARRDQDAASKLAEAKLASELQKAASIKDAETQILKVRIDAVSLHRSSQSPKLSAR